jgi:nucleotide-binding universal stress UspA family protein
MIEAESDAFRLLERVGATGDAYGVDVSQQMLRARDAGAAIVDQAKKIGAELIVIGATRRRLTGSGAVVFGSTVERALKDTPCRVMVVAAPSEPVAA